MSSNELLPCPFCGGKGEYDNCDIGSGSWIGCADCGGKMQMVGYCEDEAVAAWNRRFSECDELARKQDECEHEWETFYSPPYGHHQSCRICNKFTWQ